MKKLKFGNLNFDSLKTLSEKEQSKVIGGYDTGGSSASCSKSCDTKGANGVTISTGCYANTSNSPACLCLDRSNNSQCN